MRTFTAFTENAETTFHPEAFPPLLSRNTIQFFPASAVYAELRLNIMNFTNTYLNYSLEELSWSAILIFLIADSLRVELFFLSK